MIRIYHHIWPGGIGLQIAEQQKNRIFKNITQDFTYHPNIVEIEQNECHTLLKMLKDVENFDNQDYILYIHTKGSSKPNELYEIEWREYMELSLIDDYKTHIKKMNEGFHTSGVLMNIKDWGGDIYSGNFWWTTVKFIKLIPKNIEKKWDVKNRYSAENDFFSRIKEWKPGIIYPPFTNFNNFYNYIKKETHINLCRMYVSRL